MTDLDRLLELYLLINDSERNGFVDKEELK